MTCPGTYCGVTGLVDMLSVRFIVGVGVGVWVGAVATFETILRLGFSGIIDLIIGIDVPVAVGIVITGEEKLPLTFVELCIVPNGLGGEKPVASSPVAPVDTHNNRSRITNGIKLLKVNIFFDIVMIQYAIIK